VRTIGLLGGMSWESSAEYYRFVNEAVKARLGGLHSARCLLLSLDFAEIAELQRAGAWERAGKQLAEAARALVRGGAELVVLCTNTMHEVADAVEAAVPVPFLHIADPTADAIARAGLSRVGLLGTRYTMERDSYRGRLAANGLDVLVPEEPDRTTVHDVIYGELVLGRVEPASRARYVEVIARLEGRGAQAVILGCTEIDLLIGAEDVALPLFDTTRLHAEAAVSLALAP
jgi:aspartate racemase